MCRSKKSSISTLPLISCKPSGYAVVGLERSYSLLELSTDAIVLFFEAEPHTNT